MTDPQLYDRADVLIFHCRFQQTHTPAERERLLDELQSVLCELRLRSQQLRIV